MSTFVTFLGRGRDNNETGYREATYKFPNGTEKTTAFFGLALAEYIAPNTIVILGTKSSQWYVLVENLVPGELSDEKTQALEELFNAEIQGEVIQDHLDKVVDLIEQSVKCQVVPRLIDFGINEAEQYKILDVIDEAVPDGDVNFDLTHGFRHFGMIGFLSTFMLSRVREKFEVKNLWYGALEMTQNGITPVLKLDGLDRVRQWLEALNRFDATGNYRVFGSLLEKDGVDSNKTEHLENAAFYERTMNVPDAANEINNFKSVLESQLKGASGLFQEKLTDRLTWIDQNTLSKRQAVLARLYLERRDYVRAACFGWESLVTQECEKNGDDPNYHKNREKQNVLYAVQNLPRKDGQQPGDNREAGEHINQIRNAVTHGIPPKNKEVEEMLKDENELRKGLKKAFDCLLPA